MHASLYNSWEHVKKKICEHNCSGYHGAKINGLNLRKLMENAEVFDKRCKDFHIENIWSTVTKK